MKFRDPPSISPLALLNNITASLCTAFVAHQFIYQLERPRQDRQVYSLGQKIADNLTATRRPTEHTAVVFTAKILLDRGKEAGVWSGSDYTNGAVAGLLAYIVGRPLDQIDYARQEIRLAEGKRISRVDGIRVILRQDGWKGFYRH